MSELQKLKRKLNLWEKELETNAQGLSFIAENRVFCLKMHIEKLQKIELGS